MGEAIGSGVVPFDKIEPGSITDEMVAISITSETVWTLVMRLTHWHLCGGTMIRRKMAFMLLMKYMV